MLIDRNGNAVIEKYSMLPDGAPFTGEPVIIPGARFLAEISALEKYPAAIGVAWPNDRDVSALAPFLGHVTTVALDFPGFRDGRAYSQARQLRETHDYRGELRATGHVLQDQFQFMVRAGFDTFKISKDREQSAFKDAARRYSVVYQTAEGSVCASQIRRLRWANRNAITVAEFNSSIALALDQTLRHADPAEIIAQAIRLMPEGRLAVVSSFGIESAALLKLVADIDRSLPVLFVDTGWLFEKTISYRDSLIEHLGLTNVRTIKPRADRLAAADPDYDLWSRDSDACCNLRKVEPLSEALLPFQAWISGRKRYQGGGRSSLKVVESDGLHLKFNPLAHASSRAVAAIFRSAKLPQHPLSFMHYTSVGCAPCTTRTREGEQPRAGRWRGNNRSECGIHLARSQSAIG